TRSKRDWSSDVCSSDLHREKGSLHLRGQDRAQTRTCSFITQDPDQILADVGGDKERQTLDVVPVRVCNEKSQVDRLRSQLLFQRSEERRVGKGSCGVRL